MRILTKVGLWTPEKVFVVFKFDLQQGCSENSSDWHSGGIRFESRRWNGSPEVLSAFTQVF